MSDPFADWDGNWLTLLFTIPHTLRSGRKKLSGPKAGVSAELYGPGRWGHRSGWCPGRRSRNGDLIELYEHLLAHAGAVRGRLGQEPLRVRRWALNASRFVYTS